MNNTPAPASPATQPELLFQIAAVEALIEQFNGLRGDLRAIVGAEIAAAYAKDGTKCAVDVRIPGTKTKVGAVSTAIHAEDVTSVEDEAALMAWVEANAPDNIDYLDPIINPRYKARLLKQVEWIDDPDFVAPPVAPDAGPDAPAVEVPKVAAIANKSTGEYVTVPGLKFTEGGGYKSFAIGKRDNDAIMKYLGTINIADVLGRADSMIESHVTIAGEVGDDPDPVEPASETVVAGEVVASEDAA